MSICTDKPWNNTKLVKHYPSEPPREETFHFKNLRIDNETITGTVYDSDETHYTELHGTCSPFDSQENVTRLNFFFTARTKDGYVDIVLSGLGIKPRDSQVRFYGGFVVLAPSRQATSEVMVKFDQGDT